jgi:hypothetical protein
MLRLPVQLHQQAQEHGAEIIREMYLMARQIQVSGGHELPSRLISLIDELGNQFAGLTTDQERQLESAVADGLAEVDVVYQLPLAAAEAAAHLGQMLDEADAFCLQGKHLLTLATPDNLSRYRHWFLGQFIAQLAGQRPTPWPQYRAVTLLQT